MLHEFACVSILYWNGGIHEVFRMLLSVFVVMYSVGVVPWLLVLVLCSVVVSSILFIYSLSADLYGLTILEWRDYSEAFVG